MTLKAGMLNWVLEYYKIYSNHYPGLTLTYFMARSNLVPYAFFEWEKVSIIDFSENIVVYDIKVGRFIQLNEYMNLYEYQRSRSFIDLYPRSFRLTIFKTSFAQKPLGRLKPNFIWSLHGMSEMKICSNIPGHMTMSIYGEKKSFFFGTKRPMTLKLSIQHLVLEYYKCFHMMTLG